MYEYIWHISRVAWVSYVYLNSPWLFVKIWPIISLFYFPYGSIPPFCPPAVRWHSRKTLSVSIGISICRSRSRSDPLESVPCYTACLLLACNFCSFFVTQIYGISWIQLGEFHALSNLRWQHIVHPPCFRQYTKCKDAETYIASKIEYTKNSQRKITACVCIYS